MSMSVTLPAGAIVAIPTQIPIAISRYSPQILTTLVSAVGFARYFQQISSRVLWTLFLRASLLASSMLGFSVFVYVQTCQATGPAAYRFVRLCKQAIWGLWDSAQMRRLRKKIEFEFFTLILGGGGNNLCLVIFWPGWPIIGLAMLVFSACNKG